MKHGPAAGHRGPLSLDVTARGHEVEVAIENPGPSRGPREGSAGLPTVERRLALSYGGAARLVLDSGEVRTRVTVTLPRAGPQPGVLT
ncbi:hypothetical protein QEG98_07150 [Myxococcus sp. MxC21-1]|nr:hypothetical protein QEG98_07150 [Myxococcus sp. MxC21-1]